MRFRLPYDAYANPERVVIPMLVDGEHKVYDLKGYCLDEKGNPGPEIYVESKNVKDAGDQGAEFQEFLARAYSGTMRLSSDLGMDPKHEFMWATTCPWKGKGFRGVATEDTILEAIRAAESHIIPGDHTVDGSMVRSLAERLWVWVISERQEEMVMGDQLRGWVAHKMEESK